VGCFGQFATASFHAGRQLATGEGGAVMASTPLYRSIGASVRDGGRTSASGTRAHAVYNLRATEMQAALGAAQAEGFAARVEGRNHNANSILAGLAGLAEYLILPESHPAARPSWLDLPMVVREGAPFDRDRLVAELSAAGVAVRPFSASLPTHPAIEPRAHRLCGLLPVTNLVAGNGLLIRVPPGGGQADPATVIEAMQSVVRDLR
jgi:CDP-6-deoxy-D-xylo-4-hexulose-3-dehydrase